MSDATPCRLLFCKNPGCGRPMKLPIGKLLQLIVDPADPSIHASAIALLCHQCMTIKRYSLEPNSPDQCGEDHLVELDRISGMSHAIWLKCDEKTCKARLPLIFVSIPSTNDELLKFDGKDTYPWEDLTCPNGHPVPFPQMR
jgi:hypothetical protein